MSLQVTLQTATEVDRNLYHDVFTNSEFITVKESRGSVFGLGGDALVGFVSVVLTGVVTRAVYDAIKAYFETAADAIKQRLKGNSSAVNITINGRTFKVHDDRDVDLVLDAIVAELNEQKQS